MHTMSRDEWRAFVSEGTRTGHLATTRADGRPHVAPVWFVLDGDDLVFTTARSSVKGRTLVGTGQAAMCVDDERPPFAFVVLEGPVTISEEPGPLLDLATRIARRYMGDELAEKYGARNGVPGELLVRLTPQRVVAQGGLAD